VTLEQTRRDYAGRPLDDARVDPDPLRQFRAWYDEARAAGVVDPNAMALATATADGAPAIRMVLLKDVDERGFVWFTNYDSRKGAELAENPRAALLFFWEPLARQVRIEGAVARIDGGESDAYFAARPRAANLSAMGSPQSQPIDDRAALVARVDRIEEAFHGRALERPEHWGGYRLRPSSFEFWQGRADRLHDRIVYRHGADGWARQRLAP
jgi:pyridoxamine 5'-phosphate oxidase